MLCICSRGARRSREPFNSLFEMHLHSRRTAPDIHVAPFNSLFEMLVNVEVRRLMSSIHALSILYLRCPLRSVQHCEQNREPFNSLFEMLIALKAKSAIVPYTPTFNSLFEMHGGRRRRPLHVRRLSLSILYLRCQIPPSLHPSGVVYELSILYLRCFFFIFLDSKRCRRSFQFSI